MKKINLNTRLTVTLSNGEKITASASMLNSLSIYMAESAERYNQMHAFALANEAQKNSTEIYDFLNNKGLYND